MPLRPEEAGSTDRAACAGDAEARRHSRRSLDKDRDWPFCPNALKKPGLRPTNHTEQSRFDARLRSRKVRATGIGVSLESVWIENNLELTAALAESCVETVEDRYPIVRKTSLHDPYGLRSPIVLNADALQ